MPELPSPAHLEFDVRVEPLALDPLGPDERPLAGGATDPSGRVLGANRWHLTLDGAPYPIVAGELLPQRYPVAEWEDAVRALRDAGCTTVSSYVFWGLVEPEPGRFDFSGANDIRRFARICADYGMTFIPRIGPFNNSEFLVGGLPPWLFGMPVVERSNDDAYLALVRRYFAAVAGELRGLFFSDGGPIELVQLENELSHAPNDWGTLFGYTASEHRGPTGEAFAAHMIALRDIAVDVGISPAYFTMTGWGTAGDLPDGDLLPTYGGYMDLHHRPGPNARMTTFAPRGYPSRGRYPVAFCELGTGSPHRAAYRSRTPADMTLTTGVTSLGSTESIFLGYYLFHGGTNPVRGDGFGWTPKESSFTQRSYDFWAPVSEFGERRESYRALVPLNHFVREFGRDLARMPVVDPADPVHDPDRDDLRSAIRGSGDSGFVFLGNYGNNSALSDRDDVRLRIRRGADEISIPRHLPLGIRSGASLILPFGLDLGGGLTLVSSTAQAVARLGGGADRTLVLASSQDRAEHVIAGADAANVDAPDGAVIRRESDGVAVEVPAGSSVTATGAAGTIRIVTLTWAEAGRAQVAGEGEEKILVTADRDFTIDGDVAVLHGLRGLGETGPAPASARLVSATRSETVEAALPAPSIDGIGIEQLTASRAVLTAVGPVEELWIDIAYSGDLCRVFDAGTGLLVADDFRSGPTWRVKAGRFAEALRGQGLQLRVEPVATKEAVDDPEGILLDSRIRAEEPARIDGITAMQRVSTTVALR
ncbi:beta-galactosidase [Microbacterium halophytorum]|uniref:beta-galactosidase n=1 Tax=Microbacterium halophytorum TaxID=2067568 RepID=UPI00131A3FF4|nr:beta-galactosidase [Microbacterium halophytorum]